MAADTGTTPTPGMETEQERAYVRQRFEPGEAAQEFIEHNVYWSGGRTRDAALASLASLRTRLAEAEAELRNCRGMSVLEAEGWQAALREMRQILAYMNEPHRNPDANTKALLAIARRALEQGDE